jgi:L-lysine 2,3-aminomutase
MLVQSGMAVDLPPSRFQMERYENTLVVTLGPGEPLPRLHFGRDIVTVAELESRLEKLKDEGATSKSVVLLQTDAGTSVGVERQISELILSGGDPLSLSTPKLSELTAALAGLPHIRRLRIHTRLPVVLPERIDGEFLDGFAGLPHQRVMVVHANHPQEIDARVGAACLALRETGATVLNQSVLLRGVNDDADVLASLSERLFEAGVLPYYLHQLDRVAGAAHFEVADDVALDLIEKVRRRLPGYLGPRLVRETAGAPYKEPVVERSWGDDHPAHRQA